MRSGSWSRILLIVALVAVTIPLALTIPRASADGDDDQYTIPEKSDLKYPNLGYMLNQLVLRVEAGESLAEEAAGDSPVHQGSSMAVTIYLSDHVADAVQFLEDNGVSPRNVGQDYIEAYVPVTLLGVASKQPGVRRVRVIIPPQPLQSGPIVTGQGVQAHGSAVWNQAGYSGQGIKVGIIDTSFVGFSDLMGTELPVTVNARCYTDIGEFNEDLADCELDSIHGTVVAESVIDIAPEVSLYIANPQSKGDLQAAAAWMVSEGVSVINHSIGWGFDGPGDGSSPYSNSPLETVDRAVAGGIVWINAAGNEAETTWFGRYSNSDGDALIDFDGADEFNTIRPSGACNIQAQLRWEDSWGTATRDFDLYIVDTFTGEIVAGSEETQSGKSGDVPYESLSLPFPEDNGDDQYALVVAHRTGSAPDWLQLTVWGADSIEHYTEHGSMTNPAESANPGMLAVGAAPWFDVHTIEPFSSRGPTPDGRVKPKPDVVAADCGETALTPLDDERCGFSGTSQSAPHVAGMVALVRQRFPEYTPVQVAEHLKDHAEQRGAVPNNTWGYGFAQLPAHDAVTPPPSSDRDALVALYNATDGDNWANNDNWLSDRPLGEWYGVATDAAGRVIELYLLDNGLSGEIPSELGSLANLEGLWLIGNQLRGEIPSELGSLANLQSLRLSDSRLSGEIPAELGNLSNLETLRLAHNQLTGGIPSELGSLANLQELYLSGNQLTGCLPAGLQNVPNNDFDQLGLPPCEGTTPPPAAEPCGQTLSGDDSVPGQWAEGCESEVAERGYARYYSFTLAQESEVSITLELESGNADTYLYLREGEARSGDFQHENDDYPESGDTDMSQIQESLEAGTYTIEATTYGAGETGSFTLTISGLGTTAQPPGPTPTDPCGQTLSGDGSVPGQWAEGCDSEVAERGYARYYSFTLAQQSEVTITLTRESGNADTYLYLREGEARSGDFQHENDDYPESGDTDMSQIQESLEAGTYTIEATTYGVGETGSFTLTILGLGTTAQPPEPTPTDPCGQTLSGDDSVPGQWAEGCDSEVAERGYARYYSFTLAQQSEVTITLTRESGNADTYLYLREGEARSGDFQHENDDYPESGDTDMSQIQESLEAGTYTIEATTYGAGETGSFTLTVSGLGAAPAPQSCSGGLTLAPGDRCSHQDFTIEVESSGALLMRFTGDEAPPQGLSLSRSGDSWSIESLP